MYSMFEPAADGADYTSLPEVPVPSASIDANEDSTPRGCVHQWILAWSGRCEGCRKSPLPRSDVTGRDVAA